MPPPPAELFATRVFLGPALRAQPDRRLVDLVRNGYDAAFEEIVRRYRRPLDRFAAAIVGGRSEDVTQDAFSKALLALRGSEAEIELRPWLYRIVRNTALNDLRDRAPAAEELAETLPGGRSAAAEAETREELRELMARLRALPEPQRAALVMRELEGLSHEEIAAALGVSGGAARQAIFRARAALRDGLGLLVPMPVVRALAEHGSEVAGAGVAAGAIKVGLATVLVAGTVGAGVAIEHRQGERAGPEAAEAATLPRGAEQRPSRGSTPAPSADTTSDRRSTGESDDRGRNRGEGGDDVRSSIDGGDRSGSDDGGHHSGGRSEPSGSDHSGSSGSIDNSGPGSHNSGDDDGAEDHSGSGSGSDDGFDDHSGSSGDDGGSSSGSGSGDDDSSSGPGSGEDSVTETAPTSAPEIEEDNSGSGSDSSGSDDDSVILDAPSG
ncbi:MAG TPA: sigma-70 family RNA polymerase sigma factor [Solirubrobacterales bacterium]|nr:sigma-70 family RNA polymerase sigma factor [Solirubrobacterales bacterium]